MLSTLGFLVSLHYKRKPRSLCKYGVLDYTWVPLLVIFPSLHKEQRRFRILQGFTFFKLHYASLFIQLYLTPLEHYPNRTSSYNLALGKIHKMGVE